MLPSLAHLESQDQAALQSSPEGGLIVYRISRRVSCSNPHSPHILATNVYSKTALLYGAACGLWSCPECARQNKRRWTFRAVHGADQALQQGRTVSFVTVTPHERLSASLSGKVLPHAWDMLRRRLLHASSQADYLLVPEPHKSGKLHLHGLFIDAPLKRKWWKDNARECGFGYQADMQEVKRVGGVAAYVGKYIGKTLQNSNLPKHFHRVRVSNGFPELPAAPGGSGWELTVLRPDQDLQQVVQSWKDIGYQVVLTDSANAWSAFEVFGGNSPMLIGE